jgi:hypothetical protein
MLLGSLGHTFFLYSYRGLYDLQFINLARIFCFLARITLFTDVWGGNTWVQNWRKERTERDRLLQREIYLKEELEKIGSKSGKEDTSSKKKASSKRKEALPKDLNAINRKLWDHKQNCANLVHRLSHYRGPTAAPYFFRERASPEALSLEAKNQCFLKSGFCSGAVVAVKKNIAIRRAETHLFVGI